MYKLLLCTRYLRTKYIALASIISVMLGVATMIVVNSVMAGFSTEMRDRIHGILADVVIETRNLDGVDNPEELMQMVESAAGAHIAGMTATVEIYGMLSFKFGDEWQTQPVTLIGIDPAGKASVGPLVDYLDSYHAHNEEGKQTREALRDRSITPSWNLTEPARERREAWVEMQRQIAAYVHHGHPADEEVPSPLAAAQEAPPFADSPFTNETGAAGGVVPAGGAGELSAAPTFADFNQNMPTDTAPNFGGAQRQVTPADPADPLEARVYIGQGLISFPFEDSSTGKVRTQMMVVPGDDVKLSTVTAGRPPEVVNFSATVVDVFKSGMSEYDSNLVFCNIEYLQKVRGMIEPQTGKGAITSIQIKLDDYRNADTVVRQLKAAFPPEMYSVRTWEQKQGPLLAAVDIESTILNVLLFLIIAVAGFGILAIFYMIVVEKTRDIGILKALGASRRGVMSIFLSYGLGLGLVGSGVGTVLGLLFVKHINEIEKIVTAISGRKVFDERIYYFPEIPTSINPVTVLWVAFGAVTIAVLASILPARRAAGLHPVEALRYE